MIDEDFLRRRIREEQELATQASNSQARAAHRGLAKLYENLLKSAQHFRI